MNYHSYFFEKVLPDFFSVIHTEIENQQSFVNFFDVSG